MLLELMSLLYVFHVLPRTFLNLLREIVLVLILKINKKNTWNVCQSYFQLVCARYFTKLLLRYLLTEWSLFCHILSLWPRVHLWWDDIFKIIIRLLLKCFIISKLKRMGRLDIPCWRLILVRHTIDWNSFFFESNNAEGGV